MIIKSLNIGLPKKELFHGKEFITGMCKKPVTIPLVSSRSKNREGIKKFFRFPPFGIKAEIVLGIGDQV